MDLKECNEGGETARKAVSFLGVFDGVQVSYAFTRRNPKRGMATVIHPPTREIYRPASRRHRPPLNRTRKLYHITPAKDKGEK